MKVSRIFTTAVIGLMLALSSCDKNGHENKEEPISGPDIYVAGYEKNAQGNNVAKLWKNGVAQNLSDGSTNAVAWSVYVFGDDVYVCGHEDNILGFTTAKLWKNGVSVDFRKGASVEGISVDNTLAYSVFISNGDVYIAGQLGKYGSTIPSPVLWKNKDEQKLPALVDSGTYAYDVFVSGNNVYVCGYQGIFGEATLWKNGVHQYLPKINRLNHAVAYSVFVYENDVYVAGYEGDEATIWKNGVRQSLSDGSNPASACSVFVYEGDIFVVGYEGTEAILWKNGTRQILSNGRAWSVKVFNGDVYVAGYNGNVVTTWKNGVAQTLTNGNYEVRAYSIFVK